ncbi:MAG: triose-phosphate isomerase [Clostridia bacterium]|nr:triose-phosphate isomerase [Clostridia bacterium]
MQKLMVANYKMNGNKDFYQKVKKVVNKLKIKDTVILCPPFVYMPFLKCKNENVFIGAQNLAEVVNTKSTGEISPEMLKEFGAKYAILGHSERRASGETDVQISNKVSVATKNDIVPIICVGEENKKSSLNILVEQVNSALNKAENKEIVFAYEPIWAIGSGEIPTISQINKAIDIVKKSAKNCGHDVKVLYGGSVNASNYKELLKTNADGFLMGGVSNKIDDFLKILKGE